MLRGLSIIINNILKQEDAPIKKMAIVFIIITKINGTNSDKMK